MPGLENEGKRVELQMCVFCPFRDDAICAVYGTRLEDKARKPDYCLIEAVIMRRDARVYPAGY